MKRWTYTVLPLTSFALALNAGQCRAQSIYTPTESKQIASEKQFGQSGFTRIDLLRETSRQRNGARGN
jgi:hypothetical protein